MSLSQKVYPENIESAKLWAFGFARKYGFEAKYIPSKRAKKGELTKLEKKALNLIVSRQRKYLEAYIPTRSDIRNACKKLQIKNFVEEIICDSSYRTTSDGLVKVEKYLATSAGVEYWENDR